MIRPGKRQPTNPHLKPIQVPLEDVISHAAYDKTVTKITRFIGWWSLAAVIVLAALGFTSYRQVLQYGTAHIDTVIAGEFRAQRDSALKAISAQTQAQINEQMARVIAAAQTDANLRIERFIRVIGKRLSLAPGEIQRLTAEAVSSPIAEGIARFGIRSQTSWDSLAFRTPANDEPGEPRPGDSLWVRGAVTVFEDWPTMDSGVFRGFLPAGTLFWPRQIKVIEVRAFPDNSRWIRFRVLSR